MNKSLVYLGVGALALWFLSKKTSSNTLAPSQVRMSQNGPVPSVVVGNSQSAIDARARKGLVQIGNENYYYRDLVKKPVQNRIIRAGYGGALQQLGIVTS